MKVDGGCKNEKKANGCEKMSWNLIGGEMMKCKLMGGEKKK